MGDTGTALEGGRENCIPYIERRKSGNLNVFTGTRAKTQHAFVAGSFVRIFHLETAIPQSQGIRSLLPISLTVKTR